MKRREMTRLLLHKAMQDEGLVEDLQENPKYDDETVGFHAQQAVEKYLKALLAHLGVDFPKVHMLDALANALHAHGARPTEEIGDLRRLNPFAIALRYEDLPLSSDISRPEMLRIVRGVREYVESQIGEKAQ